MHTDEEARRERTRGLLRDLGPAAAAVTVAALIVSAAVSPASRLAPSLVPPPLSAVPSFTAPQVGGVVVTKDTGGLIVRRGEARGPVGADLVELVLSREDAAATPASPASRDRPSPPTLPRTTASNSAVTTTTAAIAADSPPPAPAEIQDDTVTAASNGSDRGHGRRSGRPDHAPHSSVGPPSQTPPPWAAADRRAGNEPARGGPPAHAAAKGRAQGR